MTHPIFSHFWRPAHIIGYEHTFIAALGEFLEALDRDGEFHPDCEDGLAVLRLLATLQESSNTRQWAAVKN